MFYDSRNALHRDHLNEAEARNFYAKQVKTYPTLDFVLIDLAKPEEANDEMTETFLQLVRYTDKTKISAKKRPTVFVRADKRLSQADPSVMLQADSFATLMAKEAELTTVGTISELADKIKKFNKSLNDTTIVYCKNVTGEDGKDDF